MNRFMVIGMAAGLATIACKKGDEHPHDNDDEGDKAGAHKNVGEGLPGLLRIDPEMVRDLRITTTKVEARPGGDGVALLGELQVNQDAYAEVGSPVSGRISRVVASPGDVVKTGQVLAEIESVELGKARAAEQSARAQVELAQQTLARKRGLVAAGVAPARELEEAEASAKAAQAELRAARTTLAALGAAAYGNQAGGARFAVRSPVTGTVLDREVTRGQVADPAKRLFRVADLTTLWLTVHAYERDALRIKSGAVARVSFPALPGLSFPGTVTLVGSQVDVSSRTIPVRVTVANPQKLLRPGMSGAAWVPVGESASPVVAVPAASIQRLDRDWVVFVPGKETNTFEVRRVGRGRDLSGEVEIISHLEPGETIVVDGAFLLKAEAEKARGMGEQHEH